MGNCSSTAIAPIDDSSVEAHDHQAVRVAAPEADDSSLKETENDDYLPDNAASYPKAIHPEASSIKLVDELLQEEELKSTWKGAEPHTWPHTMSSSPNMASKTAQVPSIQAGPSKEEPEKIFAVSSAVMTKTSHRPRNHVANCAVSLHWLVNVFLKKHPQIRASWPYPGSLSASCDLCGSSIPLTGPLYHSKSKDNFDLCETCHSKGSAEGQANGPYEVHRRMTTGAVTHALVKAAVKDRGCRYVDLIDSEAAVSRGKPFYFISHGWGRPFVELVDQIIEHFSPENQAIWRPQGAKILDWEEIYVWLDIFAINQTPGASQGDDLAQLKAVVEDSEQTLMILDKDGSVLTRIWCLFEAWHSGKKGIDALKLLAYGVDWKQLEKVFIDLDVSKAKASVIEDRDRILADIAADVGIQQMTHQLKDELVNSVTSSIPPDDEDHPWTQKLSLEIYKAGKICQLYGRYSAAEVFFRRDLRDNRRFLGPEHPSTLASMNNLASLLRNQGKLSEAEPLFRSALEVQTKVLGPDHLTTLASMNNLALLLQDQGKLSEVEPLFLSALEVQTKVLGPEHPSTLTSMNNLASLLQDQGKLSEAEPLYMSVLKGRTKVLGPDHHSTLTSMNNLALLLQNQGKVSEAEPLYKSALKGSMKVLGPEHPSTLTSMHNLASLLQAQGKLSEAEPLFISALEVQTKVLGPEHPSTLTSVYNCVSILLQVGKKAEAEKWARICVERNEKVFGPDHKETSDAKALLKTIYASS